MSEGLNALVSDICTAPQPTDSRLLLVLGRQIIFFLAPFNPFCDGCYTTTSRGGVRQLQNKSKNPQNSMGSPFHSRTFSTSYKCLDSMSAFEGGSNTPGQLCHESALGTSIPSSDHARTEYWLWLEKGEGEWGSNQLWCGLGNSMLLVCAWTTATWDLVCCPLGCSQWLHGTEHATSTNLPSAATIGKIGKGPASPSPFDHSWLLFDVFGTSPRIFSFSDLLFFLRIL